MNGALFNAACFDAPGGTIPARVGIVSTVFGSLIRLVGGHPDPTGAAIRVPAGSLDPFMTTIRERAGSPSPAMARTRGL